MAQNETDATPVFNIWIDRKVDPNLQVYPGALGPTRFASLTKIAESADCVCYPIDDCVLIGRANWVDALVAELSQGARARSASSRIDVRWPKLTTPNEALQAVGANRSSAGGAKLPHDLWPETHWVRIRPALAEGLIRGQFLQPDREATLFSRSYRFANTKAFEASVLQKDPDATFKRSAGAVRLTGSGEAHREFAATCLSQDDSGDRSDDAIATLKKDGRTFKLDVRNEMAGAIVKQLTGVAQIECDFTAEANPQLRKLVTLSVKDQTLWEILQRVARDAELEFESRDGKLRVNAATKQK
ncbi:MAG: hypothetical protein AAFX06_21000 [Planctomycetota bacterium]